MARRAAERETSYFYRKERETHELIILVVIMASHGLPAETATVAESRKMAASIQLLALVDRDIVHL